MKLFASVWLMLAISLTAGVGGIGSAHARNCLNVSVIGDGMGIKVGEQFERLFAFRTPCFVVSYLPPSRSSQMLLAGQIDGELLRIADFGPYQDSNLVRVPEPLIQGEGILVSKDPAISSLEDLGYGALGIRRGTEWSRVFARDHLNKLEAPSFGTLVEMLRKDRIEALLIDHINLAHFADQLKGTHQTKVLERGAYIWLTHEHKALVPDISRVLREFYAQGNSFAGS